MNIESTSKIILNAAVTFIQAGFATWATTGFATDKIALGAAIGAGLSLVWNTIGKPALKAKGWIK